MRKSIALLGGVAALSFLTIGAASAETLPSQASSITIASPAGHVTPVSVEDWYPWGTYSTEAACIDAGNKLQNDEPWAFSGVWCQYQAPVWKLYMNETGR